MARRPIPLSHYLAGTVLFFMVPLFLVSALSLWTIADQTRRSFVDLSSLSSTLVASRFEEFFSRPREAAAHLEEVLGHPNLFPRARLEAYLGANLQTFPYIERIQVIGPDDRVIAVAPPDPSLIGISRRGELVYEEVQRVHGLSWSESYISTRNNLPAITFGTKAGGDTLLCDLDLAWVGTFAKSIELSPTDLPATARGAEVRVTDARGVYLSNADPDRVSRRETLPDFIRLRTLAESHAIGAFREAGTAWLVSASRVSDPDWYVFVLYPESVFTDSLLAGMVQLFLLFAITGMAAILVWRLRFRRVSGALATISTEAERIARGDYGELAAFGADFSEFSRIGVSLNAMVGAIGSRERILVDRELGFREILERIDLLVVSVDRAGRVVYINPSFSSLSGYATERLLGSPLKDIMLPGPAGCPFSRLLAGESLLSLERCPVRRADGSVCIVDWSIVRNLDAEGELSGATGIGHDVTANVRQEQRIAASLREKEILLREVHHRVKNNLQIILSLLQLQLDDSEDPPVAQALGVSADRILSISLVHETIYASDDFADLDFGEYAKTLVTQLLSRPEGRRIRLESHLVPLRLDIIDAVPCGLFIDEALRFLLATANPDGAGLPASVILEVGWRDRLARVALRYASQESAWTPSLPGGERGVLLLQALADQLRGILNLRHDSCVEVELFFTPRSANEVAPSPASTL